MAFSVGPFYYLKIYLSCTLNSHCVPNRQQYERHGMQASLNSEGWLGRNLVQAHFRLGSIQATEDSIWGNASYPSSLVPSLDHKSLTQRDPKTVQMAPKCLLQRTGTVGLDNSEHLPSVCYGLGREFWGGRSQELSELIEKSQELG